MKPFGWLNTLYDTAKTGLFTTQPLNAIDSVREQRLDVVFTYLSWKAASIEYETEVKQGMENEAKQKSNSRRK